MELFIIISYVKPYWRTDSLQYQVHFSVSTEFPHGWSMVFTEGTSESLESV